MARLVKNLRSFFPNLPDASAGAKPVSDFDTMPVGNRRFSIYDVLSGLPTNPFMPNGSGKFTSAEVKKGYRKLK